MKRILLTSAAVFAFAGSAYAETHTGVTLSGTATLGFNDEDGIGDNDGFYSDLEIIANLFIELDNGITAAASLDLENLDTSDDGQDYELSITSENAGLFYGDTAFAAENLWIAAGEMNSDAFSEADGEEAIRGEVRYAGVDAQISYVLANNDGDRNLGDDLNQLSIAASYDIANFNIVAAYQEESDEALGFYSANGDFNDSEVFGISVSTTFSGVDVRLAYADDDLADTDSIGIEASFPIGPVTATVFYVSEDTDDDNYGVEVSYEEGPLGLVFEYESIDGNDTYGLEGTYDVGSGLVLYAGYQVEEQESASDDDHYYIGGEYDLGAGASLDVSYADDDDLTNDEVGPQDYQQGTTIELTFEF